MKHLLKWDPAVIYWYVEKLPKFLFFAFHCFDCPLYLKGIGLFPCFKLYVGKGLVP